MKYQFTTGGKYMINHQPYPAQYNSFYGQQNQQMQTTGIIPIKSIEEGFNYQVAPGNSVTFRVENQPYLCEKTQSFSQFEAPTFDIYRLEKVTIDQVKNNAPKIEYAEKNDIAALTTRIEELSAEIEQLKKPKSKRVKEGDSDE
jgi:hypothetical protein